MRAWWCGQSFCLNVPIRVVFIRVYRLLGVVRVFSCLNVVGTISIETFHFFSDVRGFHLKTSGISKAVPWYLDFT